MDENKQQQPGNNSNNRDKQYPRRVAPAFKGNNRSNTRERKSYVEQQVIKFGPDFAIKATSGRGWQGRFPGEASRLFRDIRNGGFKAAHDAQYIMYEPYMSSLIKVANDKIVYYSTHKIAMLHFNEYMAQIGMIDPNVMAIAQWDANELQVWESIAYGLVRAVNAGPYCAQELEAMMARIRTYVKPQKTFN